MTYADSRQSEGFQLPASVPDGFYQWLRLQNPTHQRNELPALFDKAWLQLDDAGEGQVFDVCELPSKDVPRFLERVAAVKGQVAARSQSYGVRMDRYYVVAFATDSKPSDAEEAARTLSAMAHANPERIGVTLLIGWRASHYFVDLEITGC